MRRSWTVLAVVLLLVPRGASADVKYRAAPGAIHEVQSAAAPAQMALSHDGKAVLMVHPSSYPPIAELAAPMLRLAGVRINPANNSLRRTTFFQGGFTLRRLPDGKDVAIKLPADLRTGFPTWSADGSAFAFLSYTPTKVELWIGDVKTARVKKIPGIAINQVLGSALMWLPDSKSLLVKAIPLRRSHLPAEGPPTGPDVQDSEGVTGASSTYEARDLLHTPHDADLFEYYATSELALVSASSGKVRRIGAAAVFGNLDLAPDGRHVLVERVLRPYSYLRSWSRFAHDLEVWGLDGKLVEKVASLPLAEQVPIDGVPTGPRSVYFVPTLPATLFWVEALDKGDLAVKVPHRDRLVLKELGKPQRTWMELEQRMAGMDFVEGGELALVTDWERDRRWQRTFVVKLAEPGGSPRKLWDRSENDFYGDPGSPLYRTLPLGQAAVRKEDNAIFLSGAGATPAGLRPFLDRLDLTTFATERLFRADSSSLEFFMGWQDLDRGSFFTYKQSPTEPPNLALRTLGAAVEKPAAGEAIRSAALRMLTTFPDPTPQFRGVTQRLVTFKRADGVQLSFTLHLPPGYKEGTRLPTVFWAYPSEYSDPTTAGQVVAAPNEFSIPSATSPQLFALAGYAVIEVSMPVVGPPETVYDTFIEQLVANAKAAIDKAAAMGVTDPDRVGVSGHSHGALMTATLLAHSDLFRAGIARSGAYNHTLRPFGFQTEHRTLYKARETYLKLSPLLHADKINEPLLLIHGELDANPGTVPLQSEKLFEAIRGVGGTARLVMLPFESHGYAAYESVEHVMAESIDWFDRYVKNAAPRPKPRAR